MYGYAYTWSVCRRISSLDHEWIANIMHVRSYFSKLSTNVIYRLRPSSKEHKHICPYNYAHKRACQISMNCLISLSLHASIWYNWLFECCIDSPTADVGVARLTDSFLPFVDL